MKMSDAIIKGSDEKNTVLDNYLKKSNKPIFGLTSFEDPDTYVEACNTFYDELLEQEPVLVD
jgi:hypothetical protein